MQAFGLYTHMRANRIRSILLIAGLFLLVHVLAFALSILLEAFGGGDVAEIVSRAGKTLAVVAPAATVIAAAWIGIAWVFHQKIISAVTGGRLVSREQEPRLYNLLENLCVSRGLPMPRLFIAETDAPNAYATGLNPRQHAITVTRGLMASLDEAELEAVLAHELTHIRNRDVEVMVVAVVMAGILSFVGELIFRWITERPLRTGLPSTSRGGDSGSKGKGGAAVAILLALALIALVWLLSQLIRFALSRSREYLADAGAVELTKNPDAMISALRKIAGKGELPAVPSGVMEFCLDNPRSGFADIFATHPSIDDRIAALVRFGGGRDGLGPAGDGLTPQRHTPGSR